MARETYVYDRDRGEVVTKEEYLRRQDARRSLKQFKYERVTRAVGAKYIWDRELEKIVSVSESCRDKQKPKVHVIKDLSPYKSMVTGDMVDGRRAHRDHLKRHDVVEVGNDHWSGKKPEMDHPAIDIKRVLETYGH